MMNGAWNRYDWMACPVSPHAAIVDPRNPAAFDRFIEALPHTEIGNAMLRWAEILKEKHRLTASIAFGSFFAKEDFDGVNYQIDQRRLVFFTAWLALRQAVELIADSPQISGFVRGEHPGDTMWNRLLEEPSNRVRAEPATQNAPGEGTGKRAYQPDASVDITDLVGLLLLMRTQGGRDYSADDVRLEALTLLGLLAAPATEPRRTLIDAAIEAQWSAFKPTPVETAAKAEAA